MKANPPLLLCHRERRSPHGALRRLPRLPRSCPRTAPAFVCRAARHLPARSGQQKEPQSHRLSPRPSCPAGHAGSRPLPRTTTSPFRQNILRPGGQRRGGARPPSLPPGPRGSAAEGARPLTGRAAAPGEGQSGSSVSVCHCPPAARGHPGVSAREGSRCNPARLFLTNY